MVLFGIGGCDQLELLVEMHKDGAFGEKRHRMNRLIGVADIHVHCAVLESDNQQPRVEPDAQRHRRARNHIETDTAVLCCYGPHTHRAVRGARCNMIPAHRQCRDRIRVAQQHMDAFGRRRGRNVPHADRLVVAAADRKIVTHPNHAVHGLRVAREHRGLVERVALVQNERAVRGRRNIQTGRKNAHGIDAALVREKRAAALACRNVPHAQRTVLGAQEDIAVVNMQRNNRALGADLAHHGPKGDVPHKTNRVSRTRGHQPIPVRRGTSNPSRMPNRALPRLGLEPRSQNVDACVQQLPVHVEPRVAHRWPNRPAQLPFGRGAFAAAIVVAIVAIVAVGAS
eukprot:comp22053_c0_seq1/m.50934 comp22053_c0_seq1/g.50934  ORF comp22053_c0_seq1/g.50934 comp22053_c0_seq1/m.50934 type:complete len:341 (+) comp22053_c0_seq1:870-1892(+)